MLGQMHTLECSQKSIAYMHQQMKAHLCVKCRWAVRLSAAAGNMVGSGREERALDILEKLVGLQKQVLVRVCVCVCVCVFV
jgi:hypothetical protein